ncbi:MAG: O-methyltransferase [Bacilli bacterium]|nr:O-methyltransferase [Bacilli bacterium]
MINENVIKQLKDYADINNVPIMLDDGMDFLLDYIKKNNVKRILEIGAAIGYSAIMMCTVGQDITVTTIERDEKRYLEAVKNIKKVGLQDRITLIYQNALDVELDEEYDLIFIDAAKAQSRKFFEKFEKNLVPGGTIITDNMGFHGLVEKDPESIESRNLRQLVRKIKEYIIFLQDNPRYETRFLDVGDGIAVSKHIYE